MSAAAQELLAAFDALPDSERDAVVRELLLRHPTGDDDLSDEAFAESADELFLTYDAAEAADGPSPG